ncbi:MAG: sel1 repeat family protein [Gammaproteobacteria bacterium]|nr:MAG: sel1 repeat family protein [Gammaproteobacteria bacterium]UTW42046.1 sel1 repeat family protein [bacterium SCSIO 12844]
MQVADFYYNGIAVKKNYIKALEYYQDAANQGNSTAQLNLGYMYQFAIGVNVDYAKALYWYQKSAKQNNAMAFNNIGVLYQYGHGVTQDDQKAQYFFQKAVDHGYTEAKENINKLNSNLTAIFITIVVIFFIIAFLISVYCTYNLYELLKCIKDKIMPNWLIWMALIPFVGTLFLFTSLFVLAQTLKKQYKHYSSYKAIRRLCTYLYALLFVLSMMWPIAITTSAIDLSTDRCYHTFLTGLNIAIISTSVILLTIIIAFKSRKVRKFILAESQS